MKNLNPEMIEKAKAAKSAAEFLEIAKANNVEMTDDEAATYFGCRAVALALTGDKMGADLFKCLFFKKGYYQNVVHTMGEGKNNAPIGD